MLIGQNQIGKREDRHVSELGISCSCSWYLSGCSDFASSPMSLHRVAQCFGAQSRHLQAWKVERAFRFPVSLSSSSAFVGSSKNSATHVDGLSSSPFHSSRQRHGRAEVAPLGQHQRLTCIEEYATMDKEQLAIIETEKPCLRVVAGPGSGKTRVLVHRIAHLIQHYGVSPSNILCITFTNKAADELCERLDQLLSCHVSTQLTVGTFHGTCAQLLRQRPMFGIDTDFVIYDEQDCGQLLKNILSLACDVLNGEIDTINSSPMLDDSLYSTTDLFNRTVSGSVNNDSEKQENYEGNQNELKKSHVLLNRLVKLGFFNKGSLENIMLLRILDSKQDGKDSSARKHFKVQTGVVMLLLADIMKTKAYSMKKFIAKKRYLNFSEASSSMGNFLSKMANLYECALRENNAVDFDDLIHLGVQMLHQDHRFRTVCQEKWKYVFVDEFQDTDAVQYELVRLLAENNQNLFIVGDIDQAIYGWRGAEYKHMQNSLTNDFPSIATFQLQKNYRSSENIVRVASTILLHSRYDREIGSLQALRLLPTKGYVAPIGIGAFDNADLEAEFVASEILKLVHQGHAKWESIAVMYRTRVQSFPLEASLVKAQIPYNVVGALPFYCHKEIKVIAAYLHLITNPHDEIALGYCINAPLRGIGHRTLTQLKHWAVCNCLTLPQALKKIYKESTLSNDLGIKPKARDAVLKFMQLIESFSILSFKISLAQLIEVIIERLEFEKYIETLDDSKIAASRRMERLWQLMTIADACEDDQVVGRPALVKFLETLSLVASQEKKDLGKDTIKLMTMHASKGLEFDCVFITGASDGIIPLAECDLNEERRLFYVAITRARERLYLTYSFTNLHQRESVKEHKLSIFIKQMLYSVPDENFTVYGYDTIRRTFKV